MRWNKEGIHDSKDIDIMLHPTDVEACHALVHFEVAQECLSWFIDVSFLY
jgi:hypothetical protein